MGTVMIQPRGDRGASVCDLVEVIGAEIDQFGDMFVSQDVVVGSYWGVKTRKFRCYRNAPATPGCRDDTFAVPNWSGNLGSWRW